MDGKRSPEDAPAYTLAEAAVIAAVPVSTLRSWVHGRSFRVRDGQRQSASVIDLPGGEGRFLSFTNLVEAHVLASMRREHALKLAAIRKAVKFVRKELGVAHPLATEQFKTNGVDLFVEHLGHLINASREGQLGMKQVLAGSLNRVEYGDRGRAVRLFPVLRGASGPKTIVIDPCLAFGRPVITGTRTRVADIRSRFQAGDSVEDLAADYDVPLPLIEDALRATSQAA